MLISRAKVRITGTKAPPFRRRRTGHPQNSRSPKARATRPSAIKFVKKNHAMSLLIFISIGAVLGLCAWFLMLKLSSTPQQISPETEIAEANVDTVIRGWLTDSGYSLQDVTDSRDYFSYLATTGSPFVRFIVYRPRTNPHFITVQSMLIIDQHRILNLSKKRRDKFAHEIQLELSRANIGWVLGDNYSNVEVFLGIEINKENLTKTSLLNAASRVNAVVDSGRQIMLMNLSETESHD
jgi:hypothetical protein